LAHGAALGHGLAVNRRQRRPLSLSDRRPHAHGAHLITELIVDVDTDHRTAWLEAVAFETVAFETVALAEQRPQSPEDGG
jgi:hypothetical protein